MKPAVLLSSTLTLLALATSPAAAAPNPYSGLYVFGDSLSDGGQFPDITGQSDGLRATNRLPDGRYAAVAPTLLGGQLGFSGQTLAPSTPWNHAPGGDNWAVGGYRTDQILDSILDTSRVSYGPIRFNERPGYLAGGLRADPNALYYLSGGGNDFLQGLVQTPEQAAAAAGRLAASVQALQQGGGRYFMVWMLPDLGLTPNYFGSDQQRGLSYLSGAFNQALAQQLAGIDANIIVLNVPALLQEAVNAPGTFGLATDQNLLGTCYSGDGCTANPVYGVGGTAPDPTRLLFNDAVHPTGTGHQLIADYGYSLLSAPWEITLLPEMAHAALRNHQNELRNQWQRPWQAVGTWQPMIATGGGRSDLSEQRSSVSADGEHRHLMLGASLRPSETWRLGLAGGAYRQTLKAGPHGSRYSLDAYVGSVFGQYRDAAWWADASLSAAYLDYGSLSRRFALGVSQRRETSDTTGLAWRLDSRAGYNLLPPQSAFALSPFVSASAARANVNAFSEDSERATALGYGAQHQNSRRLGLGLNALWQAAPGTRFTVEVAREREYQTDRQTLAMNLTTVPGNRFTLDGYTPPGHSSRASLGISQTLREGVSLNATYNASRSSGLTEQGVSVGLSLDI